MVRRILDPTERPIVHESPVTPHPESGPEVPPSEVSNPSGVASAYHDDAYTTEGQMGLPPTSVPETSPSGEVETDPETSFPARLTPLQDPTPVQPRLTPKEIVQRTTAAIEAKNGTTGLMVLIEQMRLGNQRVKQAMGGGGGSSPDLPSGGDPFDLDMFRPQPQPEWSDRSYHRFRERYDVSDDAYEEQQAAVEQEAAAQAQDYWTELEEEQRIEEEQQQQELLDAQDQS